MVRNEQRVFKMAGIRCLGDYSYKTSLYTREFLAKIFIFCLYTSIYIIVSSVRAIVLDFVLITKLI